MADIINKFYKKIANNGNDNDYELVGEIGVDGVPLKEYITNQLESILDSFYPVGSIYFSVKNENPSSKFGGTWVSWGAGKFIVGVNSSDSSFNSVEKTGGSKTHSHTITVNNKAAFTSGSTTLSVSQIPSHTHSGKTRTGTVDSHRVISAAGKSYSPNQTTGYSTSAWTDITSKTNNFPGGGHYHEFTTNATGGSGGHTHSIPAHNHTASSNSPTALPPYITCYMWKRTK